MEVTTTNLDLTEVEVQVKKFLWPMTDSRRDWSALARRQRNQNNSLGKDGVKGQEGGERKRRDRQTDGQFLDSSFRFNVPSTTRERQAGRQTDRQTERHSARQKRKHAAKRQREVSCASKVRELPTSHHKN